MAYYTRFSYNLRRAVAKLSRARSLSSLFESWRYEDRGGYSLVPFLETNSIFVHIPKSAGVSICRALYGNLGYGHTRIQQYELIFSDREFNDFFKFTFVRNPWDRLFSAYNFLRSGGMDKYDKQWAENNLIKFESFEQFVLEGLDKNILSYNHFTPQVDFLRSRKKNSLPMDYIGFFENLREDYSHVSSVLKSSNSLTWHNKTPGNNGDFKRIYNDKMIERVALVYKEDIRTFGYAFDNSSLGEQIASRDRLSSPPFGGSAG